MIAVGCGPRMIPIVEERRNKIDTHDLEISDRSDKAFVQYLLKKRRDATAGHDGGQHSKFRYLRHFSKLLIRHLTLKVMMMMMMMMMMIMVHDVWCVGGVFFCFFSR